MLTGSKNALKGVGFFLGAGLLALLGFRGAVLAMAIALALVWLLSLRLLRRDLGRAKGKPKFRDLLSKSRAINLLSAARLCLFASRDVWFVVALPIQAFFAYHFKGQKNKVAAWLFGFQFAVFVILGALAF